MGKRVTLKRWHPYASGKLRGYLDVWIEHLQMQINGISLFDDDGTKSIALPRRKIDTLRGSTHTEPVILMQKSLFKWLERAILHEIDELEEPLP